MRVLVLYCNCVCDCTSLPIINNCVFVMCVAHGNHWVISILHKDKVDGVLNYSIITVGHGRNEAILQSTGEYLCFLDVVRS